MTGVECATSVTVEHRLSSSNHEDRNKSFMTLSPSSQSNATPPAWDFSHGRLRVSDDKRRLVHEDGSFFLYLGDTAWELFHRLNREEADLYLQNRQAKGFTVIQAVAVAELDGLKTPNAYGELPFIDHDATRPNHRYFEHVDWVVQRASSLGLGVGLLPTWGNHITAWDSDVSFFTEATAERYGRWLGERYGAMPNILWILGGDRPAAGCGRADRRSVWDAMARGITLGVCGGEDYAQTLISYHPYGRHTSAEWFHDRPWLAFNMVQSGHYAKDDALHHWLIDQGWQWPPIKPVINAEPCYEDMCVNFNPRHGWFDDFDVRQSAYWTVFAGSFGYTYGAHALWQMLAPPWSPTLHARRTWRESLDMPGARQMTHLRSLLLARDPLTRMPAQSLLIEDYGSTPRHLRACRGKGYILVYSPYGATIRVHGEKLGCSKVTATWFNPRDGSTQSLGEWTAHGPLSFDPPGSAARGNDWVLLLDHDQ